MICLLYRRRAEFSSMGIHWRYYGETEAFTNYSLHKFHRILLIELISKRVVIYNVTFLYRIFVSKIIINRIVTDVVFLV